MGRLVRCQVPLLWSIRQEGCTPPEPAQAAFQTDIGGGLSVETAALDARSTLVHAALLFMMGRRDHEATTRHYEYHGIEPLACSGGSTRRPMGLIRK